MDSHIEIIKFEETEQYVVIHIKGYVDESNAKEIWDTVYGQCSSMNKNVLLDLSDIGFFSSGGASMGGLLELRYRLMDNDKIVILVGLINKIKDDWLYWGLGLMFVFSSNLEIAKEQINNSEFINMQIKAVDEFKKKRKEHKNKI